jgi:hypothetical protein
MTTFFPLQLQWGPYGSKQSLDLKPIFPRTSLPLNSIGSPLKTSCTTTSLQCTWSIEEKSIYVFMGFLIISNLYRIFFLKWMARCLLINKLKKNLHCFYWPFPHMFTERKKPMSGILCHIALEIIKKKMVKSPYFKMQF